MQGILYEEDSFWTFALVTFAIGGWTAWMTGRGLAKNWQPYWHLVASLLLLAMAVRFLHYALFHGTLLTLQYFLVDAVVLLVIGSLGFRVTRAEQMSRQYGWLYERTGPLTWRERSP
jgi:hypothetical protein